MVRSPHAFQKPAVALKPGFDVAAVSEHEIARHLDRFVEKALPPA
jgi:hypothetical protein